MHSFSVKSGSQCSSVLLTTMLILIFSMLPRLIQAQGNYSLSTVTADNGQEGITFDITAHRSVRLHRFWNTFNSGTGTVEIWARAGGVSDVNTGWVFLGQSGFTATSNSAYTEIPLDLDFMMNPNETWGFAIFTTSVGSRYRTGTTPYTFSDSYMTIDTQFWGIHGSSSPATNTPSWNFAFYPRQFCGKVTYDEGVVGPNDAGVVSVDSPLNFCAGPQDVKVTLNNFGTNQLTSATINWTLNGTPQTVYNWSGLLDTLNAASRMTQVTLASNMNFQSGVPYTITAWTTMPNGVADTINNNDTTTVTVQAAISGTFTVGGASPDYATLSDAVDDLNRFGVCGPVVLNIRTGSYTEQLLLEGINGTSQVNTVTFQSETGNRRDVDIRHAAAGSADNYVVRMNGASFVTFRNLSLTAAGSTYGRVVELLGTSSDNTFESLELTGVNSNTTSTNIAVVYSPSGSLNHRTIFRDCGIREGSYGMYMYGGSSSSREEDVQLMNNTFTGQYNRIMNCYYHTRLQIHENKAELYSSYSGAYFIYSNQNDDLSFERNTFFSDGGGSRYGIYLVNSHGSLNRCVNNFITMINNGSSTTRGLYMSSTNDALIAHNSVFINSTSSSNGRALYQTSGSNIRLLNNILHNDGAGYAMYSATPSAIAESDYNVLYTTGRSLAYWSGARADLPALQAASGMDQHSLTKRVTFADALNGDLHLAGGSENDEDLFGSLLHEVTDDIDGDFRVNPYRGADEACYVLPGSLTYEFVDASGQQAAYAEAPGSLGIRYGITFPEYAATVTITVRLFDVVTNTAAWETSFTVSKAQGTPLHGTRYIALPASLAAGTYKVDVIFNTKNSCDSYRDYALEPSAVLIVPEGQTPCVVWPGDANNDGIVNYGDRRALNTYMYTANMRTQWLNGPARYRADAESDPLTYLRWEAQATAPWYTVEGCHMDTDGNGMINNLDYLAMKLNWGSNTPWYTGAAKNDGAYHVNGFALDQNYPNPFNPVTMIRFTAPEMSHVHLVVSDALGRTVAELENGRMDAGMHEIPFDGSALASGTYIAAITMSGVESGITFTKTIKMVLNK